MVAEGSQTPGGEPGTGAGTPSGGSGSGGAAPEGQGRRTEGDLLAERRARRAAESADSAVIRRAEAAEATMQTLESHVAGLRQRLQEMEEEKRELLELLEAERASPATGQRYPDHAPRPGPSGSVGAGSIPGPGLSSAESRALPAEPFLERELRQVRQREYAEQQLRVEAENRWIELERRSGAEIERLNDRLSTSERDGRKLAHELERVQRELAETEQTAATDRAAMLRAERELQAQLAELGRRAVEIHRGLESEQAARDRSERLLEKMREGHHRMEAIVGELRAVVITLVAEAQTRAPEHGQPSRVSPVHPVAAEQPVQSPERRGAPARPPQMAAKGAMGETPARDLTHAAEAGPAGSLGPEGARGAEMVDALGAAVERLRARVEAVSGVEAREHPGTDEADQAPVCMSPSREPLSARRLSWWAALRARRRARKSQ